MAVSDGLAMIAAVAADVQSSGPAAGYLWGTVQSTSPVTVVLDHDESGQPREVSAVAVSRVVEGQRVYVQMLEQMLTVLGPEPSDTTGYSSDGWWWRSPTGVQVCWQRVSTTSAASSAYGSLHLIRHQWTYPRPYTLPPTVLVGRMQLGTGAAWPASTEAPLTTSCVLRAIDVAPRPQGTALFFTAMAIGK